MHPGNRSRRPRYRIDEDPEEKVFHEPLALSMLISESVYRLITTIERLIRWSARATRPHRFLLRILLG